MEKLQRCPSAASPTQAIMTQTPVGAARTTSAIGCFPLSPSEMGCVLVADEDGSLNRHTHRTWTTSPAWAGWPTCSTLTATSSGSSLRSCPTGPM